MEVIAIYSLAVDIGHDEEDKLLDKSWRLTSNDAVWLERR